MSQRFSAVCKYRRASWSQQHTLHLFVRICEMWILLVRNSFISAECQIDKDTSFENKGFGVAFSKCTHIGKNSLIAQRVFVGDRSDNREAQVISNDCFTCAGAAILSPIKVGSNVAVGINAILLNGAPSIAVWKGLLQNA